MRVKITVGETEKTLDLSRAFPLTVGEGRKLVGLAKRGSGDAGIEGQWDATVELVLLVMNKLDREVTQADLENMPLPEFTAMVQWLQQAVKDSAGQSLDRPT